MSNTPENESSGEDPYAELAKYFEEQGHGPHEVQKIMAKIRLHDKRTVHDSVMDSIAAGRFNLETFIQEALSDSDDESGD